VTNSPSATVPAALTATGPVSRIIRGRIADQDGDSTEYTTTILVVNVAPTAVLTIDPPRNGGVFHEGDSITARFTAWSDPSGPDLTAGLHFSLGRDPAVVKTSYAAASPDTSADFVLIDDGVQVVYGRVFDQDGGFTNLIATIPVAGVAPSATLTNT